MSQGVGLIGGVGPGTTVHYYERLAPAFAGREVPFVITHANVEFVLARLAERNVDALTDYFAEHARRLERAGVGAIAVASVAAHMCSPQLAGRLEVPLIDMVDCVRAALSRAGLRRVAILGTRFVVESDLYGRLEGFEIARPDPAEIDLVHDNYVKIAVVGKVAGSGADVEAIRAVAKRLVREAGAEAIVLAGTELSLAFDEADPGFPAIDCAHVHIDEIVARTVDRQV